MTLAPQDPDWESRFKSGLGVAPAPDFADWCQRHGAAVQYLNPVVTAQYQRNRKIFLTAIQAVAASLLVALGVMWFRSGGTLDSSAFAQTIRGVDHAETITWTTTFFNRFHSADEKRTWLTTERRLHAYRQPGLYRETYLDADGNPRSVSIRDVRAGRELILELKEKKAVLKPLAPQLDRGPFAWVGEILRDRLVAGGRPVKSLALVGTKPLGTGKANVVRATFRSEEGEEYVTDNSDFWIDVASKQLVAIHNPGSDTFDPATAADRANPPENAWSYAMPAGNIESEIVLDAKLDPDLFSLDPPAGFELETVPRPTVTEAEMIEYLGAAARFNGGRFPDGPYGLGVDSKAFNDASFGKRADRSEVAQRMIDLHDKYMQREIHDLPVHRFEEDQTVPKSFCYIGAGVKIGQADRIVCWYKLKSNGEYRAVYGDLTVKNVLPGDLPLPVEP